MKIEINLDDAFIQSQLDLRDVSFTRCLWLLRSEGGRIRQKNPIRYPTFVLDNKLIGYNFAQKCGYRTPPIHQLNQPLQDIEVIKNCVIKPVHEGESRGVFASYEDKIVYMNKNLIFTNNKDMKQYANGLLKSKVVKKDSWMVEELLQYKGGIAKDVKFYCFYGEVGLILESAREGELKRCWYDSDLNYANTGKYDELIFQGKRNEIEGLIKIAKKLSLEVPSPFVRIDLLITDSGIFVGEFTPLPGGYSDFNYDWDKRLGELYLRASVNLAYDVSMGKYFENYTSIPKTEKETLAQMSRY